MHQNPFYKADVGVFFEPDRPKVAVSVRVNDVPTSDLSVVEGSTVSLGCSTAVANPPVIPEATWWLRGGVIVQDARRPLIMRQLDRTRAGLYTCSATNTLAPSGESPRNVTGTATVQLQVMCKLLLADINISQGSVGVAKCLRGGGFIIVIFWNFIAECASERISKSVSGACCICKVRPTWCYFSIQYNIRLLHRSQTATTSNMKHMNTKYNSRIT